MKILTTKNINDSERWKGMSYLLANDKRYIGIKLIDDFLRAFELLKKRKDYDVCITFFSNTAIFFSFFQAIFGKKIKHVCVEIHLNKKRYFNFLKNFILRLAFKNIDLVIVHSKEEIDNYVKEFKLPKEKFRFLPFHYSIGGYNIEINDNGYIFSGGDNGRDYDYFLRVIKGLDYKFIIASFSLPKRKDLPKNADVRTTNNKGFRELMAQSSIVVIPLDNKRLDSVGHQTYLNALALGKALIISDANGVRDHINDDAAIIVKNIEEFKYAITELMEHKEKRQILEKNGKESVLGRYSLDKFVDNLIKIAEEII